MVLKESVIYKSDDSFNQSMKIFCNFLCSIFSNQLLCDCLNLDSDEDDIVIPTSSRQAKLQRQEIQNEINGSIESSVAGSVVGSEDTEDDVVVSSLNRTIPSTVPPVSG